MRANSGRYLSLLPVLVLELSCGQSTVGTDPDLSGFTETALVLSHPTLNNSVPGIDRGLLV